MTRPRVLFVSAVPDFKGGAEVVLRTMLGNPHVEPVLAVPEEGPVAKAARDMGIAVCTYHPGAMNRVHRPPRPGPIAAAMVDALRVARRLRRLARRHDCAIVHSNGLKPHMLCALMRMLPGSRPKTLTHVHDIPYRRSERALWQLIARSVDQMAVVSRPCYPGPSLPANVEIVPNGILPVRDALPPSSVSGTVQLGFVGRFHGNKGMDLLLDWFTAIRRSGIDASLTIRGRPDPDHPDYWERIQQRIRDEGLAPHVRNEGWVTGAEAFGGLDVLLVSSNVPDPAPLVVLEAMSAGVVVAGYPAGGIPWMLDDGAAGLLAADGEALAKQLRALLETPDAFEQLRIAAHARVRTEFSVGRFHERLRDVYLRMAPPRES